ncbi:InlB B-repeat-containing protein [Paenibacillus luteus]|uniref:InlB B-repeat-containing protein n=1 Tax=Paenibacillus luteus TaxID=2545753 RepID=UPI0019D5E02F|nr:InlB B-repeat-containing protein [Paenibacillus luteus]
MAKKKKTMMVVFALAVFIIIYSGIAMAQGTATLKITASLNTSTYGEEVTFTVTAVDPAIGGTTPSGTVTFKDGIQDLVTTGLTKAEPLITTTSTRVTPPPNGSANCSPTCPIIQWGAYTFWAYSYSDNRIGMNIVTYDASGNIVQQLEKGGARYLSKITMDAAAKTFTFWGQDDMTITVGWGELLSASSSASFKTSDLAIGSHSIIAAFSGDDSHAASEGSATYTVHPRYTVVYNNNGSTGGDVPANSSSYNGTKVSIYGNDGNLVKVGYTFAGWNTQADGQGTGYETDAEGVIASDVTLYAQWTKVLEVGKGTENDPYQIATGEDLDTVRNYLNSGLYYKLTADIDLSSYGQRWLPIGDSSNWFEGHMNGNGHKITGLTINKPDDTYIGLFGYIGNDASVSNMILENVNVTGRQDVGGLAGRNLGGEISNSYVTGSVSGKASNVGGLIGYNYYNGSVSNSFATANVTGSSSNIGGLIGNNYGTISYSYAAGNVTATGTGTNIGGLIGSNSGTNSYGYATGSVTGTGTKVGGLIGNNTGTISYSFYDSITTGQLDTGKGVGQTTTEMKMQSTFADQSWNFTSTWGISPLRNNGYPYLQAIQKYVTYDGNGNTGGNAPIDSTSYSPGVTVKVDSNAVTLVRAHYTFAGWNTKADGSGTDYAAGAAFSMGASNVTLYAQWTLNPTYTVTYNGNGSTGGSVPTDSGSYEQDVTVSVYNNNGNLVRTHYTFAGWNTKADGTGTDYAAGSAFNMGASNVTLYAQWTLNPTYTVTYNGNGSTGGNVPTDSGSYEQGITVSVNDNIGNLVKTGYTFAGWNTQADGTGTDYAAGAAFNMGASNVTLYAQWTLNPTYTVTYNGNGSTGGSVPTDSGSYEQGITVSVYDNIGNLVKTGYTFAGWNTQADGTGANYAVGTAFNMDASNVTLYAQWTLNPTYTVTYNGNGNTGGNVPTDSSSYEQDVTVSVYNNSGNLVKTGSTFAGWNTKADGTGTAYAVGTAFNMGASNVTLYAQWTLNPTYTVTYNGNGSTGGSVPTDSGSYEQGVTVTVYDNIGNLVKTGYTFAGWNTQADGTGTDYVAGAAFNMGASNVTLYTQWTLNPTYTVTYNGNGSTGGNVPTDNGSYEQGNAVAVYDNHGNLVKTGYKFAGWNTAQDGSGISYAGGGDFLIGSENVTLYAQWLSSNALLSALSLDKGTLNFLPLQTTYAVVVENSVSSLDFFLSKGDPTQSLTVTGATYNSETGDVYSYNASSLAIGPNPIKITVTAQDGSNTTYVITITREGIMGVPMKLDPSVRTLTYPGGLVIRLPDGLMIPEGATLMVQESNVAPSGEVKLARAGQVINFQFEGITITQPVQITLGYDESSDRSKLAIYYYNVSTGKWEYNASRVTDDGIETTVSHFSTYGVLADTTAPNQVTITLSAKTANSIELHLAANDDSGVAKYMIYRDGTLIVETAESTYVDTGLSASKTYTYTAKAVDMLGNISNASESMIVATSGDGGGSYNPGSPVTDSKVTSTDGNLTLPAGKVGEVSLGDEIKIVIPAHATRKELELRINKVTNIQALIMSKDVLLSPVFEIVKNFTENFDKPVTLSLKFISNSLKGNEKPVVFYYDELKKEWIKVGGTVSGSNITVDVNHVAKYAVFAVADAAPPATVSFSDIAAHWAQASIKQAVSAGIVSGYPDGTFKPGRTVTRAEFTVMLMNALQLQLDGAELTFSDSSKIGSWAQKSVAQAVNAGIINGYEDGSFRPNAEITRAEMTVMIAKALNLADGAAAASGFADDKDIPDWAKGTVAALKKLGIIEGKNANQFAPGDKMTRAEAVTVLLKMQEQKSN